MHFWTAHHLDSQRAKVYAAIKAKSIQMKSRHLYKHNSLIKGKFSSKHLELSIAFGWYKMNISSKTTTQSFHKYFPILSSSSHGKEMHHANALYSHNWGTTLEYSIVNFMPFVFIQSNKFAHASNKVVAIVTYAFYKPSPTSIVLWLLHYTKKVSILYGHWLLLWYIMHFSQLDHFIPF